MARDLTDPERDISAFVEATNADPSDLRRFAGVSTFTIEEAAGGWARATAEHLAEGGVFDQVTGAQR